MVKRVMEKSIAFKYTDKVKKHKHIQEKWKKIPKRIHISRSLQEKWKKIPKRIHISRPFYPSFLVPCANHLTNSIKTISKALSTSTKGEYLSKYELSETWSLLEPLSPSKICIPTRGEPY